MNRVTRRYIAANGNTGSFPVAGMTGKAMRRYAKWVRLLARLPEA